MDTEEVLGAGLLGLGEQPPGALHIHVGRAAEEVAQPEPATPGGR
jgi:hypothetical protein